MRMVILGHGYTAGALTPRLVAAGWQVTGTTRGDAARVAAAGAEPLIWDGRADGPGADALRGAIAGADALIQSIAPGADGDPVLAGFADDIVAARPRWIGYLSTTAVYGDHAGGWVDEDTPTAPASARGAARVRAEADWQALAARAGAALHVFRLAGIYGPGRGPFEKLRRGTARRIIKPGQVFSRIHVDDIAGGVMAALARGGPDGGVWNLCDDDPVPPEDVIAHAAGLIGLPLPPAEDFATAEMTPMARSFYGESKRVSNARIKDRLGLRLIHPDYRSGLAAILTAETQTAGQ